MRKMIPKYPAQGHTLRWCDWGEQKEAEQTPIRTWKPYLSHYSLYLPSSPANSCLLSLLKWQMMLPSLDAQSYYSWPFFCFSLVFLSEKVNERCILSSKVCWVGIFNTGTINPGIKCIIFSEKYGTIPIKPKLELDRERGRAHITPAGRWQFALQKWTILVNF